MQDLTQVREPITRHISISLDFALCLTNVDYSFLRLSLGVKFTQIKPLPPFLGQEITWCLRQVGIYRSDRVGYLISSRSSHGLAGIAGHTPAASSASSSSSLPLVLSHRWQSSRIGAGKRCTVLFPQHPSLWWRNCNYVLLHRGGYIKELESSCWSRTLFFIRERIFHS